MQFDAPTRLQLIREETDRRASDYRQSQRYDEPRLRLRHIGPTLAALVGRRRRRHTPKRALA